MSRLNGAVITIRDATERDAVACAAIYAHYVTNTYVTFEEEPPGVTATAARIAASQRAHAWLVAEDDGRVLGFAYSSHFKERAAYRYTCEVTIYLDGTATGQGLGRRMYTELLDRLTRLGYRQAVSVIALPHPSSVGLHETMGFENAGTLRAIGWKHGGWRDVAWYQRALGEGADTDAG